MKRNCLERIADATGLGRRKLRVDHRVSRSDAGELPAGALFPLFVLFEPCIDGFFKLCGQGSRRQSRLTERARLLADDCFPLGLRRPLEPDKWFGVLQRYPPNSAAASAV